VTTIRPAGSDGRLARAHPTMAAPIGTRTAVRAADGFVLPLG
jgi:hypothetical protein